MPDIVLLPLPFVTAALTLALWLRIARAAGRHPALGWFHGFTALVIAQALLVGLRFGYHIDAVIMIQRLLPLAVAPCLYLGFVGLMAGQAPSRRYAVAHLLAPVMGGLLFFHLPPRFDMLDGAILISFLAYGLLLIRLYRQGADAFTDTRLTDVAEARQWLAGGILFLLVNAGVDAVIAIDFVIRRGQDAATLIALGHGVISVALLVLLTRTPGRLTPAPAEPSPPREAVSPELISALIEKVEIQQLYRDPDLSLSRLARRLGVPARQVSEVINRHFDCSVSHYVNGHRIRHAAHLLETTDLPVALVMEQAGFQTKSNFNREFQRVLGTTPSQWRADHQEDCP